MTSQTTSTFSIWNLLAKPAKHDNSLSAPPQRDSHFPGSGMSFNSVKMPANATTLSNAQLMDKIKGLLFGAALGDAIGLATEFLSKEVSAKHYQCGPIQFGTAEGFPFVWDRHRCRWAVGDFTDDTDQQLLILKTLLDNGGQFNQLDSARRLSAWVKEGFVELGNKPPYGIGATVGRVLSDKKFLHDPAGTAYSVWALSGSNLAANGAVMRTAILGVPFFWDERQVLKQTIDAAQVTHSDPRCLVSCAIVTMLVARMLQGYSIDDPHPPSHDAFVDKEAVANSAPQVTPSHEVAPPASFNSSTLSSSSVDWNARKRVDTAFGPTYAPVHDNLGEFQLPPHLVNYQPKSIESLGPSAQADKLLNEVVRDYSSVLQWYHDPKLTTQQDVSGLLQHVFANSFTELRLDEPSKIGYTYKCLGSAVYCFNRDLRAIHLDSHETASIARSGNRPEGELFKRIITELTLEGGDGDTNGAVAGALLGCRIGYSRLPKDWLAGLRNSEYLVAQIEKLCDLIL
ncbi:hypothetical protein HDU76_002269 [Blyttiomyces sp. JEL0837]|nr:hypothetical protein HDU76_002269 [Blyttiomyces sp. JEL0837]